MMSLEIVFENALGEKRALQQVLLTVNLQKPLNKGGERGYDAGKKVNGRKRHIVVDCLGFILAVHIPPANIQDKGQS